MQKRSNNIRPDRNGLGEGNLGTTGDFCLSRFHSEVRKKSRFSDRSVEKR